jgi:hypothetical protein
MPVLGEDGDSLVLQNWLQVEALAFVDTIECSQPRESVEEDMVDDGLHHITFTKGRYS